MKRNTLFALIALGLGGVGVAQAQDYRQLVSGTAPRLRRTRQQPHNQGSLFGGIGVGVWVNPNFAVDLEYGINNADFKSRLAARRSSVGKRAARRGRSLVLR